MFHVIASTGRTATSLLADAIHRLPGIAACHEGHAGNDAGTDLLPLVNLDNFQVFKDRRRGPDVVARKRSAEVVATALETSRREVLVDAAYYNAVLGEAILEAHPTARLSGIIRDGESFVRSVTWLDGEDPMPVGWPAPDKELTARERFIGLGRIRPVDGPDLDAWDHWSAVQRNLWLWRETNHRLLDCKDRWPERVDLVDFSEIRAGAAAFTARVLDGLRLLDRPGVAAAVHDVVRSAQARANARSGGYQIGTRDTWSASERAMLVVATEEIEGRIQPWRTSRPR